MTRTQRFALWALLAAVLLPALAVVPRAAHVFYSGQMLLLGPFALLALLLALPAGVAPRLPRWFSGLLLVLAALAALDLALEWIPALGRLSKYVPAAADVTTGLLRGLLGTAALGLCLAAWKAPQRAGLPRPLQAAGLGLAAWWALSGTLSFRPDLAVATLTDWGAYLAVFTAAWLLAAAPAQRSKLVGALLLGGVLNAAYGLLQASGHDIMPWTEDFGGRAAGLLGNPNYLGGHLALLLPLALALALDSRSGAGVRWARWALALLLAAALFASQTRGAWAGAAVGCTLVLVLAHRLGTDLLRRNRAPLLAVAALLLLGGGAFMLRHPQALQRVADVLQGQDREAGRRVFLMHKTAQLAAEHPLFGVGPGNYRIWFASVEVKGLAPQDYLSQDYILSEHGHNDFLQMAADSGVLAALLWAALLWLVLSALWRGLKVRSAPARMGAGGEDLLGLGALGGLVALSVHGLGNFPFLILPTQASAWALAAVALRALAAPLPSELSRGDDALIGEDEALTPIAPPARGPQRRWLALSLVAVVALTLVQTRRLLKDMYWWVGEGELGLTHQDTATPQLLRALDFDRREDRLWKLHGRSEAERGYIWNSIGSLREAVRLAPFDAEAAVRLGRACVENKLFDEAVDVLYKVSLYAPNFVDLWEPLAAAYYQQGKFKEAITAYDWMLFFNANTESAYANKAAAQGSLGQLPEALLTLHQAQQHFPGNGKIQVNLAITYLKLGMRSEARLAWKEADRLLPSDPQVDQLRKVLH